MTLSKRALYADPERRPRVPIPNFDAIPAAMRRESRWVLWKLTWKIRKGNGTEKGKWDKVPHRCDGRRAKSNDPTTWATFDLVKAAYTSDGYDGVGFMLGDGWTGIDLDDVRDQTTGELQPHAAGIVTELATYAEVSPSGTGVKIFGKGQWPADWHRRALSCGGEIEGYGQDRYFTVTGQKVGEYPVAEFQAERLVALLELVAPAREKQAAPTKKPMRVRRASQCDDALLEKIRESAQGDKFRSLFDHGDLSGHGGDDSRADMALCCILAWWVAKDAARIDRLFRLSKLFREKWDEERGEATYGALTIAQAIDLTDSEYDPAHHIHALIRGFAGTIGSTNGTPPEQPRHEPSAAPDPTPEPEIPTEFPIGDFDQREPAEDTHGESRGASVPNAEEEEGKKGRPSPASRLVELTHEAGVRLFHTPDSEAFAQIPNKDWVEVYPVKGTQFRRFLSGTFFRSEGKAVNGEAMANAIATLEAIAMFDCGKQSVHLRVAPGPAGSIVLDLCDDQWRAVVIRPGQWEVVTRSPVMFTRSPVMRPLPLPTRGGKLTDLRRFLNLKSDDDWLLVVAWLASAVRPTGPYPVLHPKGEQGTSKTTFGRMLRRLFDPNRAEMRSQPREERDLAVSTRHGWLICYDNLSAVPLWLSDALCRVATGGGFGTRTLYTDSDETVFDICRPVLITSIEDVIGQPDLLDRSLAIELQPIPDEARKTEARLWADFDAARPGILGGLLDVIAQALALMPDIVAENFPVPRMADFAIFGEGVARALGNPPMRFIEVLNATRAGADQDALQGSTVAPSFFNWIQKQKTFVGTYTVLLQELNGFADEESRKRKGWPPNAQALSGQIRRVSPALRRLGVDVQHNKNGRSKARNVVVNYDPERACKTSSPSSPPDGNSFPGDWLGADDVANGTSSADRPQYPESSAYPGSDLFSGDDPLRGADEVRTIPSFAPNPLSGKVHSGAADDGDDVFHTFSDATHDRGDDVAERRP
jgi:hypothetical protein